LADLSPPTKTIKENSCFLMLAAGGAGAARGGGVGGWVGGWVRGTRTGRLTGRSGWERGGLGRLRGRPSARPSRERRGAELDLSVCEIFRLRDLTRSRVISPGCLSGTISNHPNCLRSLEIRSPPGPISNHPNCLRSLEISCDLSSFPPGPISNHPNCLRSLELLVLPGAHIKPSKLFDTS